MELLRQYALAFAGVQYHWGGDDPVHGFDCSGFVEEILKSSGVLPHSLGKLSAQMLYNWLERDSSPNVWALGSIAFYGQDVSSIGHIGFCLDQYRMIEAGGGAADTVSGDIAAARNAFIRIRPIKYRRDFLCVLKPRYSGIGVI
jgi:cell wall-associated NlpC family hydrolase